MNARVVILFLPVLLTACLSRPERPALPAIDARDAAFSRSFTTPSALPVFPEWWQRAAHADYRQLIDKALSGNVELKALQARTDQARARLAFADADRKPDLTASTDATGSAGDASNSTAAGVDLAVPIDLFGQQAAVVEAARAAVAQAEQDYRQRRAELARDILLSLLDYAQSLQRQTLTDRQIDTAQTLLRLTELRFVQGQAASADVLQQRDQLASLRQQYPALQRAQHAARNQLLRLAGAAPGEAYTLARPAGLPQISRDFLALQPRQLVDSRPDLAARRAALRRADSDFEAALLDRLPDLQFSSRVLARTLAGDTSSLFAATLSAAFSLFDQGRNRALVDAARAALSEAGLEYLEAWLRAVQEVDTLLLDEQTYFDELQLSEARLGGARDLLKAVRRRYERGITDYLPVLSALSGLQQQERDQITLRTELARSRVRLHYALGANTQQAGTREEIK